VALPIACVEVATLPEEVATLPEGLAGLSDPHEQAMITSTSTKDANVSNTFLLGFMVTSFQKWWIYIKQNLGILHGGVYGRPRQTA
jgi:hypothetical protein